jgi:antitoxin component YwqK of YwqJK toxin-antitoxin module
MKRLFVPLLFVALLLAGCGGSDLPDFDDKDTLDQIIAGAIDKDKIQRRGIEGEELSYAPNKQKPYTGWTKKMYDNGQVSTLIQFKDGERYGRCAVWYATGQKLEEYTYRDYNKEGPYNSDSNKEGPYTAWYATGQKRTEATYMDGKLMTAVVWKPNGEKCPLTNVVNGNGVKVYYRESGQKDFATTFKDGTWGGLQTGWYDNGQKMDATTYKDGEKEGLFTQWYPTGQKHEEKTFKDGKLDGLYIFYDKDGVALLKGTYKDGEKVSGKFSFFQE